MQNLSGNVHWALGAPIFPVHELSPTAGEPGPCGPQLGSTHWQRVQHEQLPICPYLRAIQQYPHCFRLSEGHSKHHPGPVGEPRSGGAFYYRRREGCALLLVPRRQGPLHSLHSQDVPETWPIATSWLGCACGA